jgi:hypothetical protein
MREREGVAVAFLSNREGIGGGGNRCGRIDDGRRATEQLRCRKKTMTGKAGLGLRLGCYLLCCAADRREGELAGPRNSPTRKREGKPLSFFFSVFLF